MIKHNSVSWGKSLLKPSAIGEVTCVRGKYYMATSLNPPTWEGIRDGFHVINSAGENALLFENCEYDGDTGSIMISDNKITDYGPLPSRHYYDLAKGLVTQREAFAIYRAASSKPELVDKFLELNYHQLRIFVLALGDNSVISEPEMCGFFAEILSKGLNLHCERLENDICLVDLNENFSDYRAAWSDTIEKVAFVNSKLMNHLQKKYNESLGKLCDGLDATVPNKSGKTFYGLLEKHDYFLIKGIVSFFEAVRLVVAAKVGCGVSEVDLFYYFCGGGEVKVNFEDLDTRRSLSDIFYALKILDGFRDILKEIGFNFITLD